MATQSTTPSSPDNPQKSGDMSPKQMEGNAQESQDFKVESADGSFRKVVAASAEPIREEQVQNAVKFLQHPKVRGSPVIYRRSFLEKKGLSREEIDEAFRRVPDPPSNATADAANQASQLKPPTSSPPQVQTPQPMAAPNTIVSVAPSLQKPRILWSHAFLALGLCAATGAGTAVFFKKAVVPRLKAWIRNVVKEEDDEQKSCVKPSPAEEAAEAAKAAASAAALVAKASQELLSARSEEKKYFEAFKGLLDVQVDEIKSMGSAIRKLEASKEATYSQDKQIEQNIQSIWENGPTNAYRSPHVSQSDPRLSSKQGKVNGAPDVDFSTGRPTSVPGLVDSTATPYSKSFMEIMAMVQRGETPPGIKEINDMPPNPNQLPPNPRVAPRLKPWETNYEPSQLKAVSPTFGGHDNGYTQLNGKAYDGSDPSWKQKSVKITEIEPELEEPRVPTYGIGSNEWPGRGWVPPQTPTVAMPEAAAAIRQPKSSIQKQQVGNEHLMVQPDEKDVGSVEASDPVIPSLSSGSMARDQTEIQEEGWREVEAS